MGGWQTCRLVFWRLVGWMLMIGWLNRLCLEVGRLDVGGWLVGGVGGWRDWLS